MIDTQLHKKASRRPGFSLRKFNNNLAGPVCILLAMFGWLGYSSWYRRPFTCAVCRATKVDHQFVGRKWSDLEDTDCSRWYNKNVEPSHVHSWIGCSYCRPIWTPGLKSGYGCFVGQPLTGLSRTVQINIYDHFNDSLEAKQLFIKLGQANGESDRLWKALMDWVDEDFPGTWRDWLKQHGSIGENGVKAGLPLQ